jgi:hypothetical protein
MKVKAIIYFCHEKKELWTSIEVYKWNFFSLRFVSAAAATVS